MHRESLHKGHRESCEAASELEKQSPQVTFPTQFEYLRPMDRHTWMNNAYIGHSLVTAYIVV